MVSLILILLLNGISKHVLENLEQLKHHLILKRQNQNPQAAIKMTLVRIETKISTALFGIVQTAPAQVQHAKRVAVHPIQHLEAKNLRRYANAMVLDVRYVQNGYEGLHYR